MDFTEIDAIIGTLGADVDDPFFIELKSNLQKVNPVTGNNSFGGVAGTTITIPEQANTDYMVFVVPTADPGGNLGEVWFVPDSTTEFTVYNSGLANTAFRWMLIPGN